MVSISYYISYKQIINDMAENIEILLEDVSIEKTIIFLSALANRSNLLFLRGTSIDADITDKLPSSLELKQLMDSSTGDSFYLWFSDFKLLELRLPYGGIQIYKYSNVYDLSIDFPESYFDQSKISIVGLQGALGVLADELNAKLYCCGYEPVVNLDTRFFTDDKLGPLVFNMEN